MKIAIPFMLGLFLVILVILVSCTRQDITDTQNDSQNAETSQDIQDDIPLAQNQYLECGANQVLQGNSCECEQGYKVCNKACVPEATCCSNNDCTNSICDNGVCKNPCEGVACSYRQVCDPNSGQCGCEPGTKWCAKQNFCIGVKDCCDNADCVQRRDGKQCTEITVSMNVCINDEKSCKFIQQNIASRLESNTTKADFFFEELYEGDKVDLKVNNESFSKISVPGIITLTSRDQASLKEIKVRGGQCTEFD